VTSRIVLVAVLVVWATGTIKALSYGVPRIEPASVKLLWPVQR
jgi:hypothetical protein